MPKINYVRDGKVVLLGGGGKIYTDVAARFVRSERELEDIVASPYDKKIVENILSSGHWAALEFDFFIFGLEGYSRVTETQLVRKRLASYLIKSGRQELNGKREFSVVLPADEAVNSHRVFVVRDTFGGFRYAEKGEPDAIEIDPTDLLMLTELWYNAGVKKGLREENLRYLKPQATEFKAIIGMNAHALLDWFGIRCCHNAQAEIRDLAMKMLFLCKDAAPDLFATAGANCVQLGYCPENDRQCAMFKNSIYTQNEARKILKEHKRQEIHTPNGCAG